MAERNEIRVRDIDPKVKTALEKLAKKHSLNLNNFLKYKLSEITKKGNNKVITISI